MIVRWIAVFALFAAACGADSSPSSYTFSKISASTPRLAPVAAVTTMGNMPTNGTPEATVTSFVEPSSSDDDSLDSLDSDDNSSTTSVVQSSPSFNSSERIDDSDDSIPSHTTSRTDSTSSKADIRTSNALSRSVNAALTIGSAINATSTIQATYVNWVGSALDTSIATACYREAHIAKKCPLGFEDKLGTCWAQCPYAYPVECGLECIRQNDDCALEIVTKVSALAQTTLSLVTYDVFGKLSKLARGVQVVIKCAKYMMGLIKALAKYVRSIQVTDPQTSQDKLLAMLYQTDNVVIDIPIAVSYCIGKSASDNVKLADSVLMTAEYVLREVVANGATIVSSWDKFTSFMKNITLGDSFSSLNETDITSLKSALQSNSTCGYDMKRLLDRTWMTIAEFRKHNPSMSEDDIRVAMSKSNLVLSDIAIATNNCMSELVAQSDEKTAYATRDLLRKTFGGIVDDLISSGTSSNGTYLSAGEYAFKIADKAFSFYAIWDPWSFTGVISEYFQPICGPTEFIGEIDDGDAEKALGMSIVQGAFNNSDGTWTRVGDGSVDITFKSVDTKDVTVNIKSGGDKIDEVDVPAGKTATWKSNVTALGGKTLYLDRWRPGFLGLPGTGGGSLLLWVPRSTQGGSLKLTAKLNVS
ncbi:hypothetical protein PF005_g66 [Phytophthora fragariae]|uniref:Uncharacterized protein n=1 Tax=Phytophthora fragariae TaxID=53985 RepID=A0A6A3UXJ0_9STRA|nr:hypothetical protein PF003_g32530 [Phytophthora fragariae]KAE8950346.1 hypothetical protein PF009_g64 [Phytophthora fragariae]KAE9031458.1 hypothetical protein PF011_g55 [Phytophthora fragariae]KAE9140828.1 hypothetical protein PF010_g67 [Phytophthora fragariae]KAE9141708.1 hypothetical protein PF007_g1 [Phytophthora fragariae]